MAERTLSSEIEPLSEDVAKGLADAIEEANAAQEDFIEQLPGLCDGVLRTVETEMAVKTLSYAERFAKASFLTRWYWKRKVEKSRSAFEETHKAFEEWRGKYANH